MYQLENLREKLYKVIDSGDSREILKISQELDRLILLYTEFQVSQEQRSFKII